MAIADDIAIDSSGNIYYTGAVHGAAGAGYYTTIEVHRFLQDLADDASATGNDLVDITKETPSDRLGIDNIISILTGYRLDDVNVSATDAISEHIYDGSMIQQEDGTIWDGIVLIANEGCDLQIIQNGAIVLNDFWNTVPDGETLGGLNRDVANGIAARFMLKVNNAGTPIDGRRVVGITRVIGKSYSEFKINGTGRGNNSLPLTFVDDLNDTTDASARVAIANLNEGYTLIDIDGNGANEPYYSNWNKDIFTINQFYERMKWLAECKSGSTDATANATLYGLSGNLFRGVTQELTGTQAGGTFVEPESLSWSTGTGQLLATDSTSAATKLWIQILTGTPPSSGTVTGAGAATFTVSGFTERAVAQPFCGQSTGSALIGAFGFGIEVADTSAADLFLDLTGTNNRPQNNVTFTVGGIVSGEDRVLVGPENGAGGLRDDQCQVATGETITVTAGSVSSATAGAGNVVLASNTETIGTGQPSGTDTPSAGTIRVLDANGVYQLINYTGRTFAAGEITFTGCTGTGTYTSAATNAAFISYIDKLAGAANESFTAVYDADRSLFIRVRDGGTAGDVEGIKTFETTGTLGSAGGSTTAIRTSDV